MYINSVNQYAFLKNTRSIAFKKNETLSEDKPKTQKNIKVWLIPTVIILGIVAIALAKKGKLSKLKDVKPQSVTPENKPPLLIEFKPRLDSLIHDAGIAKLQDGSLFSGKVNDVLKNGSSIKLEYNKGKLKQSIVEMIDKSGTKSFTEKNYSYNSNEQLESVIIKSRSESGAILNEKSYLKIQEEQLKNQGFNIAYPIITEQNDKKYNGILRVIFGSDSTYNQARFTNGKAENLLYKNDKRIMSMNVDPYKGRFLSVGSNGNKIVEAKDNSMYFYNGGSKVEYFCNDNGYGKMCSNGEDVDYFFNNYKRTRKYYNDHSLVIGDTISNGKWVTRYDKNDNQIFSMYLDKEGKLESVSEDTTNYIFEKGKIYKSFGSNLSDRKQIAENISISDGTFVMNSDSGLSEEEMSDILKRFKAYYDESVEYKMSGTESFAKRQSYILGKTMHELNETMDSLKMGYLGKQVL